MARDLENGEEERFARLKKPYLAALRGDWDDMKRFFDDNPGLLLSTLTIDKDTAFHIAAYSEEKELLEHLVQLLPPSSSSLFEALKKTNKHGNNTFHEVATTDRVDTAEFLVKKLQAASGADEVCGSSRLKELLEERTQLGETPLYRAAAFGQTKMAKFLAKKIGVSNLRNHFRRNDQVSILHIAVIGQHFDTAIWLLGKDKELAKKLETDNLTCLHLLAKMPSAFRSSTHIGILKKILCYWLPSQIEDKDSDDDDDDDVDNGCDHKKISQKSSNTNRALWRYIAEVSTFIKELWKMKIKHAFASRLTELLVKADSTWVETHKDTVEEKTISFGDIDEGVKLNKGKEKVSLTIEVAGDGRKRKYRCTPNEIRTPLLTAASEGIVEIFDKIIEAHPQAIEHLDKDEENILHVAVAHRQKEIFGRLEQMMVIRKCRLVSRININGYTLLHQVADMQYYQGDKDGPCLQLQEELEWLERVRKIIPSHYVLHRDKAGNTADEIFKDQHTELLERAQKWIKETAQSCSAVSVLVASLVYAAAYQPPGDLESERNTVAFKLFTVMDVTALACSLTSVVTFLSILSSPYEYDDFRTSLPRKLAVGFSLLFISVITTMISFGATIFLILHFEKKAWTNTLIYSAAFFPVSVFALTQFPLYSAFLGTLQILYLKIVKMVNPRKLIPRYLRTSKSKTY